MNPLDMEVIDVMPIILGMVLVSNVEFVDRHNPIAKNWMYGFPSRFEHFFGVIAFVCGAINFRFFIRLTLFHMKQQFRSLKTILSDFAVCFVSETLAAGLGTMMTAHWWIRINSMSRCINDPESKACEYEAQWVVGLQRILLNAFYSEQEILVYFDGCNPPRAYTAAYFVHALPAFVYTCMLALFSYGVCKFGSSGGEEKKKVAPGSPGPSVCSPEDLSPPKKKSPEKKKKTSSCSESSSDDSDSDEGDLCKDLDPEVKEKLDQPIEDDKKGKDKKTKKDADDDEWCIPDDLDLDDKYKLMSKGNIPNACRNCNCRRHAASGCTMKLGVTSDPFPEMSSIARKRGRKTSRVPTTTPDSRKESDADALQDLEKR